MKKKVLILTADAGFGHRSAANAIQAALAEAQIYEFDVRIENLLNYPSVPALLRNTQTDYDQIVKDLPKFYEFSYESSDKPLPTQIAQIGLSAMLYKAFQQVMDDFDPDIIINTYPFYHGPAQTWYFIHEESWKTSRRTKNGGDPKAVKPKHKPFITVITDLVSVHMIWMSLLPDAYCVATEAMKEQTVKAGFDRNAILCTGIPVKPVFATETRSKSELRNMLGWDPDKTTLLSIGSKRISNLLDYLAVINHSGFDIQLAMLAGGDEELYREMQKIEWHIPVKIYNYSHEIPAMLKASDAVVTKAGGLITSESLAAGVPMILVDVLPGQEEGNALFVEENNAGKVARNQIDVLKTLAHWLNNEQAGLKVATENAKRIGKPRSSMDVVDLIIKFLSV